MNLISNSRESNWSKVLIFDWLQLLRRETNRETVGFAPFWVCFVFWFFWVLLGSFWRRELRRKKGNVKREPKRNPLPLKQVWLPEGSQKRRKRRKWLHSALISRTRTMCSITCWRRWFASIKTEKKQMAWQPLASFFCQAHKTPISQSRRLWDIRCTHIIF